MSKISIPTMSDVAKAAGVSRPIASAILNQKTNLRYSEATRERVLATAQEIGYRPNRSARNFVRNRHGVIDVVPFSIYDASQAMINGMLRVATEDGQLLNLNQSLDPDKIRCLYEDGCDAVVLIANNDREVDDRIDALKIPLVRVNCEVRDRPGCINFDEDDAMARALDAFGSKGRRKICMLNTVRPHFSHAYRENALRRLIMERDLNMELVSMTANHATDLESLLAGIDMDALLLQESHLGRAYRFLRRQGKEISKDVSVFCLHAESIADALDPRCTGLRQDQFNIGATAIETANRMIAGDSVPPRVLPYLMVEGDSV